jgi:hypothetical protein
MYLTEIVFCILENLSS